MRDLPEKVIAFLKEYDFHKIMEAFQTLDWGFLLASPIFWISGIVILTTLLLRRMFRLMMLAASIVAFMVLAKFALPPPGTEIHVNDMFTFFGGTAALVAINFYFLVVR